MTSPTTPQRKQVERRYAGAVEHGVDDAGEAGEREHGGDVEAAVEGGHGIFGLVGLDHEDADDAGDEVDGEDDEREEDALESEDGVERGAEDHGAYVFGGGGFEDVRAAAGAVADVVADEVRDDGGIAGIVFGDAGFDLADEVGAYVGGLGVDAAAELGEERNERGAEAEADQLVGNGLRVFQTAEEQEQRRDAEQRERDDDAGR